MNGWVIAGIVLIVVVPPFLLAYSLCRVAGIADQAMEEHARNLPGGEL